MTRDSSLMGDPIGSKKPFPGTWGNLSCHAFHVTVMSQDSSNSLVSGSSSRTRIRGICLGFSALTCHLLLSSCSMASGQTVWVSFRMPFICSLTARLSSQDWLHLSLLDGLRTKDIPLDTSGRKSWQDLWMDCFYFLLPSISLLKQLRDCLNLRKLNMKDFLLSQSLDFLSTW